MTDGGAGSVETVVEATQAADDTDPGVSMTAGGKVQRGTVVGERYVVLDSLGAGAMGVVCAAYDPELDRRIALKLLRKELVTDQSRMRLVREAQTLAKLDHPNVVTVYDVGSRGAGLFIAMELVDGLNLREWLAAEERPVTAVLAVFSDAALGLAAAHRSGVVHRDFKPENVMVDREGRVRVMDFGIARHDATDTEETTGTIEERDPLASGGDSVQLTRTGAAVGTPAYMAPEQHTGETADASSDQFGFCVALYEALYGVRPFRGNTLSTLALAVVEGDLTLPPRRADVPARVREAIVRGLSVERDARWPGMEALRERLDGRRSRSRWVAVAATLGVVALGALASGRQGGPTAGPCDEVDAPARGAWDAAATSIRPRLEARPGLAPMWHTLDTVAADHVKAIADGRREACEATHVRREQSEALLDREMACLDAALQRFESAAATIAAQEDPEALSRAIQAVESLPDPAWCLDKQAQLAPPDPPMAAEHAETLARAETLERLGRWRDAETALSTVAADIERAPSIAGRVRARYLGGRVQEAQGEYVAARTTYEQAAVVARSARLERPFARAAIAIAGAWTKTGAQLDGAFVWLDVAGATLAAEDDLRGEMLNARGNLLHEAGRDAEAIEVWTTVSAWVRDHEGGEGHLYARALYNHALSLEGLARHEEALELLRSSLEIDERVLGPEHPGNGLTHNLLGANLRDLKRFDEAIAEYQRAREIFVATFGEEHPHVATTYDNEGNALSARGDNAAALEVKRKALEIRKKVLPAEHPDLGDSHNNLAVVLKREGKLDEAAHHYAQALRIWSAARGPEHPDLGFIHVNLGLLELAREQREKALEHLEASATVFSKAYGDAHPHSAMTLHAMGQVLMELGRHEEAIRWLERAVPAMEALKGDDLTLGRVDLAESLWHARGETQRSRALLKQADEALTEVNTDADRELRARIDRLRRSVR